MSANKRWRKFLDDRLERYHEDRNHPDLQAATGLSPWLHFGHISSQRMVKDVLDLYGWDPGHVTPPPDGRRSGWWGLPAGAEAFLDQVVTWRDLAFIHAHMVEDHENTVPFRNGRKPRWPNTQKTQKYRRTPLNSLKRPKPATL